ncbi:hypothetical protein TNIN_495961 [Trichonephila inaurata madagascariensis]|uniref:Uncharacterized protein n=1 Tax=Trichonephila inaurata madagascariensis TaxID=2747483 RepID=A0A8X6ID86_9ARAC|nr:hypothetical protein TNIN_495961 [Trichonephila inaurata madagascariensis]
METRERIFEKGELPNRSVYLNTGSEFFYYKSKVRCLLFSAGATPATFTIFKMLSLLPKYPMDSQNISCLLLATTWIRADINLSPFSKYSFQCRTCALDVLKVKVSCVTLIFLD